MVSWQTKVGTSGMSLDLRSTFVVLGLCGDTVAARMPFPPRHPGLHVPGLGAMTRFPNKIQQVQHNSTYIYIYM